jgi:hypothetical protein
MIINMNGDVPDTLIGQYIGVVNAAEALRAALMKVECHGRNQYTKSDRDERDRQYHKSNSIREWAVDQLVEIRRQMEGVK